MKKKYILFFSFILFIFFMGSSYSSWSYNFNIVNIINTYEFSAKISVEDLGIIDKKLDKDKSCEFQIPLLKNKVTFDIENTGTIPIYIKKIEVWYDGENREIIKKFNYCELADFKGSDLLSGKLEISIKNGDYRKEDFYIEPLNSKEESKESLILNVKNKISKTLLSSSNIFENYDNEITQLHEQVDSNNLKIENIKKSCEKDSVNTDSLTSGEMKNNSLNKGDVDFQKDISKLEKDTDILNKRIGDLQKEKSNTFEKMKNDKIKIKFYFERFNR